MLEEYSQCENVEATGMLLTQCNHHSYNYRKPEDTLPTEHDDFVDEVAALKERIDDDPQEHDDGGTQDDDPSNDSPAAMPCQCFEANEMKTGRTNEC